MTQIEYTKKPSIVTLSAAIKKAVKAGSDFIQIRWGENQITLEKMPHGGWLGTGWLGKHSGSDLASKLTVRAAFDDAMGNPIDFMRDHFKVIHIK